MAETPEIAENKVVRKFVSDVLNEEDSDKHKVIIIRQGDAPKQLDAIKPNKVHVEGIISAPSKFYEKRKGLHNPDKCHVLFNRLAGTIVLIVDENFSENNYKITGKVIENPELKPFCINEAGGCGGGMFQVKELMEVLKFNRIHFKDQAENAKIVTSLRNFKAKAEQTFNDVDDNRGNSDKQKITKLETELAESFLLEMAIHKGGEKKTFKVDILCKATSTAVEVYLESVELHDLKQKSMNEILETELKAFAEIVCIEQQFYSDGEFSVRHPF